MKAVYRADAVSHAFVSSDLVPDDYVLQANETFENPSGKVTPAKLSGATWLDATPEEHQEYLDQMQKDFLAQHPEASQPAEPDKSDQAANLLGQQIAKMQQQQATMAQSINTLGQLVAKAQSATAASQAQDAVSASQAQDATVASQAQSAVSASQAQDATVASQAQSAASASQAQGTTADTKTQA